MPGLFLGRHVHYLLDEHRLLVDPLTTLQLTEAAMRLDLCSPFWLSPAAAAAHRFSLRFMASPVNLWAPGYGESFRLLPSKMAALQRCPHVSLALKAAEARRVANAQVAKAGAGSAPPHVFLLAALPLTVGAAFGEEPGRPPHQAHTTRSVTSLETTAPFPFPFSHASQPQAGMGSTGEAERHWALCPAALEPFFLNAARAHMPLAGFHGAMFWVSETIATAQEELREGLPSSPRGPGADGDASVGQEPAGMQTDAHRTAASTSAGGCTNVTTTTPYVCRTLINTEQLIPCRRLEEVVAMAYDSFCEKLGQTP